MSHPIPTREYGENENDYDPSMSDILEAQQDGGLCGKLIRECQEVQRKAFTFEGICEQLGYKNV